MSVPRPSTLPSSVVIWDCFHGRKWSVPGTSAKSANLSAWVSTISLARPISMPWMSFRPLPAASRVWSAV
ncbi:hypothetical protein SGLAM104S_02505 [Streptomyces glaucescens]